MCKLAFDGADLHMISEDRSFENVAVLIILIKGIISRLSPLFLLVLCRILGDTLRDFQTELSMINR